MRSDFAAASPGKGEKMSGKIVREPFRVRDLELRNRIVMPPTATHLCEENGTITDVLLDYYRVRTEGRSLGMVILEHSFVMQEGKASEGQVSAASDDMIPGLRRIAELIRSTGTVAVSQINHAGSAAIPSYTGCPSVGPSALLNPGIKADIAIEVPSELTEEELADRAKAFAEAAVRVKKAGFDAVEVHAAHGYFLCQFLSPLTNHRTDAYGGSRENRMRFPAEVLKAVRAAVGPDFPVFLRLGGCDYLPDGNTPEDAVYYAEEAVKAGADLIDISGGMCRFTRPGHKEPGYFSDVSEAVRRSVSVPVLVTGGVKTLEDAESILAAGRADLIGVGRSLIRDPGWADREFAK